MTDKDFKDMTYEELKQILDHTTKNIRSRQKQQWEKEAKALGLLLPRTQQKRGMLLGDVFGVTAEGPTISATLEHADQAREALADRWPDVHFDVSRRQTYHKDYNVQVKWEDGPLEADVEDHLNQGIAAYQLADIPVVTDRQLSLKLRCLAVLLDYQRAASGQKHIYDGNSSALPGFERQSFPWRDAPRGELKDLAQTLALLYDSDEDNSFAVRYDIATKFVELGGWSGLRDVHANLYQETDE